MNWRTAARVLDWAVPIGFGIALCVMAPLRTALQFGADEGYELMKAFLVSLGHPLYREVWNDQPPLHTELLALLFRVFGSSAYAGRLLSVGFAMLLVWSLYKLVCDQSGRGAGLVAVLLLISSSLFLRLSVSVMIELPAMALALAAVWAWSRYFAGEAKCWLIVSAVLFGCALQVKLTAIIFLPAFGVAWLVRRSSRDPERPEGGRISNRSAPMSERGGWDPSRAAMLWSAVVVAVFGLVAIAFYGSNAVPVIWLSHFSEATRSAVQSEAYGFRAQSLLNDLALLVPAAIGIALIGWKRRWDWLFPVALLGTAFAVHLWHRPYWDYYGLHFAIPMAWLGGVGIIEWFRVIWKPTIWTSMAAKVRAGVGWLGWSMVVSLVLTSVPEKLWNESRRLSSAPKARQDPFVVALRKHAARTRWVFTDRVIYAFWAGLPVPPELAVIPSKRIWSGQISETEVLEYLKRYRPEQIFLLSYFADKPNLSDYIREHYQPDPGSEVAGFYLRSDYSGE